METKYFTKLTYQDTVCQISDKVRGKWTNIFSSANTHINLFIHLFFSSNYVQDSFLLFKKILFLLVTEEQILIY